MHIRTFTGRKIPLSRVMNEACLKRRQVAYLAARGRIPGAQRAANGYHFEYFDTREYRCWLADRKIAAKGRNKKDPLEWPKTYLFTSSPKTQGPQAMRIFLDDWKRDVLSKYPLFEWPLDELMNLKRQLLPFHDLWEQANKQAYWRGV